MGLLRPPSLADADGLSRPGLAFAIDIALNVAFVLVEAGFGWYAQSLALMADSAHNLGNVGAKVLASATYAVAKQKPDDHHTYGWRRDSIRRPG